MADKPEKMNSSTSHPEAPAVRMKHSAPPPLVPRTKFLKPQMVSKQHRVNPSSQPPVAPKNNSIQPSSPPPAAPKDNLRKFLCKLGLEKFYPNKLTLRSLLEVNNTSVSDESIDSLATVPQAFMKRLMMVNADSRCYMGKSDVTTLESLEYGESEEDNEVNPLDLITALFLCADSFLQQELTLKMSMCQFAVPLLLPQGSRNDCTLMLWALRSVLKEWRPHDLSESKGFLEDSVVHTRMPLISFVRLSDCSLSKSQVLNQVLSNAQQHHNFFTHREMECGDVPRNISNGLVEICWFLPCGKKNIDILSEPVIIANMRGDVCSSEKQFRFLMTVSAATFVFLDRVQDTEHKLLTSLSNSESKLFLVVNSQRKEMCDESKSLNAIIDELKLQPSNIIKKTPRINSAKFSNVLCTAIKQGLQSCRQTMTIEAMSDVACKFEISVDEINAEGSTPAKKMAEMIIKGIGVRQVVQYKKSQLPLQGEHWKRLAQLEKEECRLQNSGNERLEEYKAHLQKEKEDLRKEQIKHKKTKAMQCFITAISKANTLERAFFLKWLKLKLDVRSRKDLTNLRNKIKEQSETKQDKACIVELDQQLMDSSLGIEHYMREMGQIYEASFYDSSSPFQEVSHLPALAAELLLDGFPLELVDGDASNIPVKWVSDVLMELHRKVGQHSRLLVLTVLGVQSTGKSTLLNTMFGVQFSVSSGRCTRGAFMLFLPVGEDLEKDLGCDFMLLIDTEGLKSPDLAQLADSYEHDNELATLVIGLSDVTIINIAMENSTEMKDILQIAVHAFLRMKEVGKKPVCHFVHQNVAGLSAHNKNTTDRKHLLEQLNEMTEIAAHMERQPGVSKFTDVLDYDMDKNNWYIPGLWHGTPPMAPVNTGYSEAVYEFKQNLIQTLKMCREEKPLSQIPDFLEWMSSLWKAVKYENFIFSFRNTLVAHAYDTLCKEFSEWEWSFRKAIYAWQAQAEVQILNFQPIDKSTDHQSGFQTMEEFQKMLKSEASCKIAAEEKNMIEELNTYYRRKDRHVSLVEKYRADFFNSIRCLRKEIEHSVNSKLDAATEMKKNMKKVKDIHQKHTSMIEEGVLDLLKRCKNSNTPLPDKQLEEEFEKMWNRTVVNITGLNERNIAACVYKQLRRNLERRAVNEDLVNAGDLTMYGKEDFKASSKRFTVLKQLQNLISVNNKQAILQNFADDIIENCKKFITDVVKSQTDYHDSLTQELLEKIDDSLKQNKRTKTNSKFEFDLKLHICGFASWEFQQMHKKFLSDKDPLRHLQKSKSQYLSDFMDQYRRRDQCQRKAQDFTQVCLRPSVIQYISRSLGIEIVEDMLTSSHLTEYSSRSYFQYTILKELLEKDDFRSYLRYLQRYQRFVRDWIFNHITNCFSKENSVHKFKTKSLKLIIQKIISAIESSKNGKGGQPLPNDTESTRVFIQTFCKALSKDLLIPMDAVAGVLFQIRGRCHTFAEYLTEAVKDLETLLHAELSQSANVHDTLSILPIKPQDVLFERMVGCGQQCPFCKVPCEAGGKEHREHYASVHRPEGLVEYTYMETKTLSEKICTTSVYSKAYFQSDDTNGQPHPFRDYRTIYPDWKIPPDPKAETSDYWKYVLMKHNDRFAAKYNAKPAVIPEAWTRITKERAMESLKVAFNVK